MGNFMKYFLEDFGRIGRAVWNLFSDFFYLLYYILNFPMRMGIIEEYSGEFSTQDWIMMLVANILLLIVIVTVCILLLRLLRRIFRFRVPAQKYDAMKKQVRDLQRDLLRANYEKDKLLQMNLAGVGGTPGALPPEEDEEESLEKGTEKKQEAFVSNRNTFESPCVDPETSRFFRLTTVDNFYKAEYKAPTYDDDITLPELCERFRAYSAMELGLYYDISMMRNFISAMSSARIIILQGISGTGKTSLAYAFGKFLQKETSLVPVQPSWRERTELYGYYNEFTKKYTETEFLKAVYEANYYKDPHLVILDEMNIARVEYYFAEMLSILEMPNKEDWKVDIVSSVWDNDPCLIQNGIIPISDNTWFVGTINNDDSTFAVADKVYDRAIPIDLDSRAETFTCENEGPVHITTEHLEALFAEAREAYPVTEEMEAKLEELNNYLIRNFKLAFGNRIVKQLRDFVPVYIACGGTEVEAVDFITAKKVLRKFESLSLGFMKDQLSNFESYLDKLFGKDSMKVCKEYIEYLKMNN